MRGFHSTVWRIVTLHGVAIAVACVLLPLMLAQQLHATAEVYEQRLLKDRLALISHTLSADAAGRVSLPVGVEETVRGDGSFSFIIADPSGRVLLASRPAPAGLSALPTRSERYFRMRAAQASYTGVAAPARAGHLLLTVQVVQNLDFPDVVIDDVEAAFVSHIAWVVGAVLLGLFALDLMVVRSALRPIERASADAQTIDTARLDVRLDERGLPNEIRPLAKGINKALERLERGFRQQREFTADVAHELRTPLSVMRLRVDGLADLTTAAALRADLDVMSRVVDQLLMLAEVEAAREDEAECDLWQVAERVVRHLAPAAIARGRELALTGLAEPNPVKAGSGAVFQALRNLVENALHHTPERSAVEVRVEPHGLVHVLDAGAGVPESERELIFQRRWRRDRQGTGAGLGLAIVARIAAFHGGSVGVQEAPGGGADFFLRMPSFLESSEQSAARVR
ncbi:MAG TPA: ATP-binding protein [Caulobacteraceae bacterium]|nr:ATP-binding protein [Caulobacteraceae bacterium]